MFMYGCRVIELILKLLRTRDGTSLKFSSPSLYWAFKMKPVLSPRLIKLSIAHFYSMYNGSFLFFVAYPFYSRTFEHSPSWEKCWALGNVGLSKLEPYPNNYNFGARAPEPKPRLAPYQQQTHSNDWRWVREDLNQFSLKYFPGVEFQLFWFLQLPLIPTL